MSATQTEHLPKARTFRERIGKNWIDLVEADLDIFDEVVLWPNNPRLWPVITGGGVPTEDQLEAGLRESGGGYDALLKSIKEIGQLEPIFVWRRGENNKYLVFEGATRVTCLRELERKLAGRPEQGTYRKVKAKILPPEFNEQERAVLLAGIHVRGSGVRHWGRYVEARFVYEHVNDAPGKPAMMTMSQLAEFMGKSPSWVSRLNEAYEFAKHFMAHVDDPEEAGKLVKEHFSTLEEISKSTGFGVLVRDYDNPESEELRGTVFDMVRNRVFKEYRDARFMKQFFEDPDKWELLKTGEEFAAHSLANDIRAGQTGIKAKLESLAAQIDRAIKRQGTDMDEEDLRHLHAAVDVLESHVHQGVSAFRLRLSAFTNALNQATLSDIKLVSKREVEELDTGLADFRVRLERNKGWE